MDYSEIYRSKLMTAARRPLRSIPAGSWYGRAPTGRQYNRGRDGACEE